MSKGKYIAVFSQLFLISIVFILIFYNWENIANLYVTPLSNQTNGEYISQTDILPAPC
jgi:hypothetical protein